MPRLLIVGGNGFIGRHVAARGLSLGWQVTCVGLSQLKLDGAKSVIANISDIASLRVALPDPRYEYVVNCGGYIDHTLFKCGGRANIEAHFEGLLNLVEIVDRDSLIRFVNIGSSDEYGNAPAPQQEHQREAPISPYALGKVAGSHFLQMIHRTENFPGTVLRLFLTYGPRQDNKRFIPQIIEGCLRGSEFPTSKGEQLRDFCFVEDTVDAVYCALLSNKSNGEIFNVGSGNPVTIKALINRICSIIGKGEPRFGEIPYRIGENMSLYANIEKIQRVLGWAPKVSLDEGLSRTIDAHRNVSA